MNKFKLGLWATLKDQASEALENGKRKLNATIAELERTHKTIEELTAIKTDYHPDKLVLSEKSGAIGQIQRNWNFVTNIEEAIRKTTEQKLLLKKKEREFRRICLNLELEVQKYEALENRAYVKYKKTEAISASKVDDEIAASFWMRTKVD
jgi:flagellar biosynthesis chaperone FliJ